MKKVIPAESEWVDIGWQMNLDKMIKHLLKVRETTPGEARAEVAAGGYDQDEFSLYFTFKREETDEEYQARQKKEYWEKKRIDDDEKEMYRKLKAKFEGDTK